MEKKLPRVFANKIEKELNNNKKVYIASKDIDDDGKIEESKTKKNNIPEKTIEQKINEILKAKKSLYKIPVKLETNKGKTVKKIIGKNTKSIITIENELIPIEEIKNIEIDEE